MYCFVTVDINVEPLLVCCKYAVDSLHCSMTWSNDCHSTVAVLQYPTKWSLLSHIRVTVDSTVTALPVFRCVHHLRSHSPGENMGRVSVSECKWSSTE